MKKSVYIAVFAVILAVALLMPYGSDKSKPPQNLLAVSTVQPTPAPTAVPSAEALSTATPTPMPTDYVLRSKKYSNTYLEDVERIQLRLKEMGYYAGEADGYYGDSTFSAIVAFQRNNGLEIDGMAGVETQKVLFEAEPVYDALGKVFVPFTEIEKQAQATAQPTQAPAYYALDSFEGGNALNELLLGGTNYVDGAIEARLSFEGDIVCVSVSVSDASMLRSCMGGSLTSIDYQYTEVMAKYINAVVAFAGTQLKSGYEVRQGYRLCDDLAANTPLLVIDCDGEMHLFTSYGKASGLEMLHGDEYMALSVPTALIINGIVQSELSESTDKPVLVFGQTDELSYILAYSPKGLSEKYLASYMLSKGCESAAVIGCGGIYTGFGALTESTLEGNPACDNIIYFAAKGE